MFISDHGSDLYVGMDKCFDCTIGTLSVKKTAPNSRVLLSSFTASIGLTGTVCVKKKCP